MIIGVSEEVISRLAGQLNRWSRRSDEMWDDMIAAENAGDMVRYHRKEKRMYEADGQQAGMLEVLRAFGFDWKITEDERGREKFTLYGP